MTEAGFTFQPVRRSAPTAGFALSVAPERGWTIAAEHFSEAHVRRFVRAHSTLFQRAPALHAGGWLDRRTGTVHLDLAVVEQDGERALDLARRHGQLGVFDLVRGRTIRTGRR